MMDIIATVDIMEDTVVSVGIDYSDTTLGSFECSLQYLPGQADRKVSVDNVIHI